MFSVTDILQMTVVMCQVIFLLFLLFLHKVCKINNCERFEPDRSHFISRLSMITPRVNSDKRCDPKVATEHKMKW